MTIGPNSLPDPPPSAGKWLDIIGSTVNRGLLPVLLLALALWWSAKQQDQLRSDLKDARAETKSAIERCIARTDEKSNEVKAAVKEVRTEVKATSEAVKAAQPAAPAP